MSGQRAPASSLRLEGKVRRLPCGKPAYQARLLFGRVVELYAVVTHLTSHLSLP